MIFYVRAVLLSFCFNVPAVPGPLVDISLTPQSANALTISWRPLEIAHGKIIAYEITLQTTLSSEESRITVSGGNVAATATGLGELWSQSQ